MALQTFTAGQILTAAQVTALQANDYNQTVSAKTGSYVLTAADKGTRITMSSASATTITVNTSLFAAGDSLRIQNIGAGVCTITAGTATVTSAGPLALVQWAGGQLFFTSASAAVWFPDAVTASAGALVRVGGGTLSGNTTITSAFNSTYDAYRIIVTNLTISAGTGQLRFKLGTTATGYYFSQPIFSVGGSLNGGGGGANSSYVTLNNTATGTSSAVIIDVMNPYLSVKTMYTSINSWNDATSFCLSLVGGYINNTTSYTSFTLEGESGNLAGTVNVYGYSLS